MLPSTSAANGRATVAAYHLRKPAAVRALDTGNYEVLGTCGHRIDVVRPSRVSLWEDRIAKRTRHSRACYSCPRQSDPA